MTEDVPGVAVFMQLCTKKPRLHKARIVDRFKAAV